jgi:hypothetical protein
MTMERNREGLDMANGKRMLPGVTLFLVVLFVSSLSATGSRSPRTADEVIVAMLRNIQAFSVLCPCRYSLV